MKVYHGSYTKIIEIDLSKSRDNRDLGKGFYVTSIRSQAEYWAVRMGKLHGTEGVITEFTFYDNAFTHWELKTLQFDRYTEAWLDFVVKNRDPHASIPAHDYDIVEGPIANDNVADRIVDYLDNRVSKTDFLQELSYHKPTHQICLCTLKSLQMIEPTERKYYTDIKHLSRPIIETLVTEYGMVKSDASDTLYNSDVFTQLSDKTTKFYLKDWQEIYEMLKKEIGIVKNKSE
ncbi:MAG: DUF3990 domain-containing protein [Bacteroidales bacterium]|jgi:hypothetical protein|nr:DUF3990 domain-containing protein [Bacteroidales bacterium]